MVISDNLIKEKFEILLSGNTIEQEVNEVTLVPEIEKNSRAIWSLFLFVGYLTYSKIEIREGLIYCDLKIPNKEIKLIFDRFINDIFEAAIGTKNINILIKICHCLDLLTFSNIFQKFVDNNLKIYKLTDDDIDKIYHIFFLGLKLMLKKNQTDLKYKILT